MLKTLTTVKSFTEKFIRNTSDTFEFQKKPVQAYPLSLITKYLAVPFPLIQADHNILIYLQSGGFTKQIEADILTVDNPSMVFLSAGTIHSLLSIEEGTKGYFILIENKSLNAIFNTETILNLSLIQPVIPLDKIENVWITTICRLL